MNLYTKESGSGQPMVLLHGNGEDSSYFVNQMSFFESKYHVIAVDTRGHGRSPRGDTKCTSRKKQLGRKVFHKDKRICG